MGLDPSAPTTTLLLVILHTGTMFAVIAYFWKRWRQIYFTSGEAFKRIAILIVVATVATGVVGGILKFSPSEGCSERQSTRRMESSRKNEKSPAVPRSAKGATPRRHISVRSASGGRISQVAQHDPVFGPYGCADRGDRVSATAASSSWSLCTGFALDRDSEPRVVSH